MRKFFLIACVLTASGALAQTPPQEEADYNKAAALCEQSARDYPVPAEVKDKILLGRTGEKTDALLNDESLPTQQQAAALNIWRKNILPCTQAMGDWLTKYSPEVARMRAELTARNEKIVAALIARTMSFGEANRQFVAAQHEFDLVNAAFLQARRRQVLEQQAIPLMPGSAAQPSTGNAAQQAQDNATVERLLDEALKARSDAARPGLCPGRPTALPNQTYDPVNPNCN